jgi:uncharacterized protein (TIGR03085 family)
MDSTVAAAERTALADALVELGPDHDTLCEGWTNDDLVAHLVVREHQPLASAGLAIKPLAGMHERAITKAKARHSFAHRVEVFRTGPPMLWKPVDKLFNSQEYFIHHEDVRRGDGTTGPRSIEEIAEIEQELWRMTGKSARLAVRGLKGIGVDLVTPDGDTIHARSGDDTLSIVGRPGEIVLYLAGRRGAAQVELEGSDHAIAVAGDAHLGI